MVLHILLVQVCSAAPASPIEMNGESHVCAAMAQMGVGGPLLAIEVQFQEVGLTPIRHLGRMLSIAFNLKQQQHINHSTFYYFSFHTICKVQRFLFLLFFPQQFILYLGDV